MTTRRPVQPSAKSFPENSWTFRRRYVWGVTISCGALELVAILTTAPSLGAITIALCVLVGFVALIYLVAPSAEHWVRMISLRDTLNTFWSRVGGMGGNPYGEVMSVPPDEVG